MTAEDRHAQNVAALAGDFGLSHNPMVTIAALRAQLAVAKTALARVYYEWDGETEDMDHVVVALDGYRHVLPALREQAAKITPAPADLADDEGYDAECYPVGHEKNSADDGDEDTRL